MAASLLLLVAAPAPSQQPVVGGVGGVVVSILTGEAVAGAVVLLDDGRRTRTGADGRFAFAAVPAGVYRIAAIAPGCNHATGEVEVRSGRAAPVRIAVLPEEARALPRDELRAPRSEGSAVRVLTADDLRRMSASSVQDAIRSIAPEMVASGPGSSTGRRLRGGRGNNTVVGPVTPVLIVDGARVELDPAEALGMIAPEDVFRIEIIRGPSGGWAYGSESANGVIRIFTLRSRSGLDRVTPAAECGFRFPDRT